VISLTDPSQLNSIFTANLSILEVLSAFNRRLRETSITKADYDRTRDGFLLAGNEYEFIKLDSVISLAQDLLEKFPLRAGDAVQLASAVVVRTSLLNAGLHEPIFLASDNKLLDAATAEGFTTDNPLLHP
jgi:predicted nucleic acid-binding protein